MPLAVTDSTVWPRSPAVMSAMPWRLMSPMTGVAAKDRLGPALSEALMWNRVWPAVS